MLEGILLPCPEVHITKVCGFFICQRDQSWAFRRPDTSQIYEEAVNILLELLLLAASLVHYKVLLYRDAVGRDHSVKMEVF